MPGFWVLTGGYRPPVSTLIYIFPPPGGGGQGVGEQDLSLKQVLSSTEKILRALIKINKIPEKQVLSHRENPPRTYKNKQN
jgi:hypothetical protein